MRVLGISGSLRATSSNTTLLKAAAMIAAPDVEIVVFSSLGDLPHFNPDFDESDPPPAVARFRAEVAGADALMISSPEYAHGVPGTLKNALDWLVGGVEINGKPVGLLNASARATRADASLRETLSVMGAIVISRTISLDGRKNLDAPAMIADPEIAAGLKATIAALAAIRIEPGLRR